MADIKRIEFYQALITAWQLERAHSKDKAREKSVMNFFLGAEITIPCDDSEPKALFTDVAEFFANNCKSSFIATSHSIRRVGLP